MADISKIKLPDGNTYDVKDASKSSATNWVNGTQAGSVRTIGSAAEDSGYTMGTYAVAEGASTVASGTGAHAEGSDTTASGGHSHAEGYQTQATNSESHAEGYSTKAIAGQTHAEGYGSEASGSMSHSEGYYTKASGNTSHAEGYQTVASGGYSHAEGYSTKAAGYNAHVEGSNTTASGSYSHVSGKYNKEDDSCYSKTIDTTISASKTYYTYADGLYTAVTSPTVDNIDNYYEYEGFNGIYAEIIGNGAWNSTIRKYERSNARTLDWSGNEVLSGKLTVGVAGTNSLDVATIGQLPTKTSDLTNDSGFITTDSDEKLAISNVSSNTSYYPILGNGTTAQTRQYTSNLEVINAPSSSGSGYIRLTIGNTASSNGARGWIRLTSGQNQHYVDILSGQGMQANTTVYFPTASGTLALTSDIPSVPSNIVNTITTIAGAHTAISNSTGAVSFNVPTKTSHLTNDSNFITLDNIGVSNGLIGITVNGIKTISSTNSNLVNGSATGSLRTVGSTAENSSYTIGENAFAEGYGTIASGIRSHAEGRYTTASGPNSHAEGWNTTASGSSSHAQNLYTIAVKSNQTAIGKYNIEDTAIEIIEQKALIIGNGLGDDARSNALTVDWSGNVDIASGAKYKINGTALSASDVGAQPTLVSGTNIKTINNQSLLGSGNLTISSGLQNLVDGSATGSVRGINTAVEDSSYTMGTDAFAEGNSTIAKGFYSHAEGSGTTARGFASHAEGADTIARGPESHAEGGGTVAHGSCSHAEGVDTAASGEYSHAEGLETTASGICSHSQNTGTIAQRMSQTALGEYNIADTGGTDETTKGNYTLIIGNGTSSNARSNALTVDWSGNVDFSGKATDSTGNTLTPSVELAQAEYDALTMEEKNNGTVYYITDGQPENYIVNDSVPIGAIQAYGGATAPANWLMCDGSAVSRTTYSELFSAIGTAFGEGDGSTTFNLPDLRGRAAIGSGLGTASDAVERSIGQAGGSERITLTSSQVPRTPLDMAYLWKSNATGGSNWGYVVDWSTSAPTEWAGDGKAYVRGGGESHGNMQPYVATNYIIKAKDHSVLQADLLPMLDLFYPVGCYFETSDSSFDPNVSIGGTWTQISGAALSTDTAEVIANIVSFDIGRARASHTSVTAPNVTGYTFICWGEVATNGWVGGVYPSAPTSQTSDFWVETSDGQTTSANVRVAAIYRKNKISVNKWHRTA